MSKFQDKEHDHKFLEIFIKFLKESDYDDIVTWGNIFKVFTCIILGITILFLFILGIWGLYEIDYTIHKGDNISDCSTYSSSIKEAD